MNIDFDDLFDTEPAEDIEAVHETEVQSDGNESGNEADENAETEQNKTDDVDVDVGDGKAKKKRVSRPQPKLNGDRLCGARGIGIMEHTFSGVTFQGRGHEQADLAVLMAKLQHWAHRMFPKMPFDSALERIEKLGKTKPVHTNVRKIRMGLSVLPTVIDDDDDPTVRGAPEVDVFDELIGDAARHEPRPSSPVRDEPSQPSQSSQAAPATTLSEEQQERMRKNRELAQLRRMRAQFSSSRRRLGRRRLDRHRWRPS
ncbi:TIMELESS-interacting protein-like [Pollicipes pollicipes]|uniref:TIMELESS-interacting protein-like n=1 Tax=Pollicipes pollicipes TaxID=41117 RepID=UPI00188563FD|nr:TIMELESS-interacting protein-like [Pollicipes pollicipes]